MNEAHLLEDARRLFAQNGLSKIGNDCALFEVADGYEIAISSDLYHANIHFPSHLPPADVAWHCLGAAISDLAAVGAAPLAMTLAISAQDATWIEALLPACLAVSQHYHLPIVGGDISAGPVALCITVLGQALKGQALTRTGARAEDEIWISGYLGEAAAGLHLLLEDSPPLTKPSAGAALMRRFCAPEARLELGQALVSQATAAIDISDGLLIDLQRLLQASGVGALLDMQAPVISKPLARFATDYPQLDVRSLIWSGGDDYELCFTAPVNNRAAIEAIGRKLNLALTSLGFVRAESGLTCKNGELPTELGWQHFASKAKG